MAQYEPLGAQCFLKRDFQPMFTSGEMAKLLYACHVRADINAKHPRILHAHKDLAELVLVYQGSGKYLIGDKQYHIKNGDLLIYNAGTVHDETPVPDTQLAFYTLAIGGLNIPGLPKNALIREGTSCCYHTKEYFQDMFFLFRTIFYNVYYNAEDATSFCNYLIWAVLCKTLTLIKDQETLHTAEKSVGFFGRRVMNYINENFREPITIDDIAVALKKSRSFISHVFKEETGYTPNQYLIRRRIGEAQTLLITTDIPIIEISGMIGYDTQNYFTSQFTKYVGMSPDKFRKNYLMPIQKEPFQRPSIFPYLCNAPETVLCEFRQKR